MKTINSLLMLVLLSAPITVFAHENHHMDPEVMGGYGWGQNMMSGWNWFSGLLGFYMILAIIFLGTGIAAFIKYLTKDKKK